MHQFHLFKATLVNTYFLEVPLCVSSCRNNIYETHSKALERAENDHIWNDLANYHVTNSAHMQCAKRQTKKITS